MHFWAWILTFFTFQRIPICLQCKNPYGVDATGNCSACIGLGAGPDCASCGSNNTRCSYVSYSNRQFFTWMQGSWLVDWLSCMLVLYFLQCKNGFVLDDSSGNCVQCVDPNCSICFNRAQCNMVSRRIAMSRVIEIDFCVGCPQLSLITMRTLYAVQKWIWFELSRRV